MQPWSYPTLGKDEIRLIDILPSANHEAPIELIISHTRFIPPPEDVLKDRREPLTGIRKTLPPNWNAYETRSGRLVYYNLATQASTWQHPGGLDFGDAPPRPPPDFEPVYEALSYTWGDPDDRETCRIKIKDGKVFRALPLGQNLASALRHLRHASRRRRLWVDAICINQGDLGERADQVLRMRDIYRLAARVVVWLGPSDDAEASDLAMETLRRLGRRVLMGGQWLLPSPDSSRLPDFDFQHATCGEAVSDAMWQSVFRLAGRSWFDRVWTIQEVQLANKHCLVQCGHVSLPWVDFLDGWHLTINANLPSEDPLAQRLVTTIASTRQLSSVSFSNLMWMVAQRSCSDPRDKIHGVLGLLPPTMAREARPDYSASVSEVYKRDMLRHITAGNRLTLLDHCDIATKLSDGPSWVPNWQDPSPSAILFDWDSEDENGSCGRWSYKAPDVLRVAGVRKSHVTAVSPVLHNAAEFSSFVRDAYLGRVPGVPEGKHLEDYVYLAHLGRIDELSYLERYPPWEEATKVILDYINAPTSVPLPGKVFVRVTGGYALQVRICFTEAGFVGLGPSSVETGDILAVILSCGLPKLLRPVPGQDHFQLIGSCRSLASRDREPLLGPVPEKYLVNYHMDASGAPQMVFYDRSTGETPESWATLESWEDPRLERLPEEWAVRELSGKDDENNDGFPLVEFTNAATGEVTRADPRMTPEAFEARGVELEMFEIK
ncbi:heterokaryon incompatibility protein-domain-containing protein [Podospora aff. communis PSN243]|uniref:Heterokaryon incompatibility protein-domain-containing protein n=1 Tax=Podospora aff. communis PSN243 TaxID=3040156 RepID=A0AAV9H5S1_9PEZI|nr:heterokaryon incompatibility protein-domain-containing protein [Podospora aff. communis PSN243]